MTFKHVEVTLSEKQIEQQDLVDNNIFELLAIVLHQPELVWDIELIGDVRDAIGTILVRRRLTTEQNFYPFIPTR